MSPITRSRRGKTAWKCFWTWLHVFMHKVGVILAIPSKCLSRCSVWVIPEGKWFNISLRVTFNNFLISDLTTLQHSWMGLRGALYGASRNRVAPWNASSSNTFSKLTWIGALSHTMTTFANGSDSLRSKHRNHSQVFFFIRASAFLPIN